MAHRNDLSPEYIRESLDYDGESGNFTWRVRPRDHFVSLRGWRTWNAQHAGTSAGSASNKYVDIRLNNKTYRAHRLAWVLVTGSWPAADIDHADLDKSNNKWSNLRDATKSTNGANRTAPSNNTSGIKGVYWFKPIKKWKAQIMKDGVETFLGYFDKKEDAARVRAKAECDMFGEFARVS